MSLVPPVRVPVVEFVQWLGSKVSEYGELVLVFVSAKDGKGEMPTAKTASQVLE